jgi:hypothetical protein
MKVLFVVGREFGKRNPQQVGDFQFDIKLAEQVEQFVIHKYRIPHFPSIHQSLS